MDTLVGGYHAEAELLSQEILTRYSSHPGGYYAQAAVLYARMVDMEDSAGRADFMTLTARVIEACAAWHREDRGNPAEIAFLEGSARSLRGLLLQHEGKTLAGLRELIHAKGAFDDAIRRDSLFFDAYLGRGAYRYGVARNASLVSWLPFIPSAKSGWDDLWTAVQRSRFSRYSALTAIVWFALDDGNFPLADSICNVGLRRFPENRNFLFPRMAMEVKQKRWSEAETTAQDLLRQYLQLPANNGYETTGLYWRLMRLADEQGRGADACAFARAGLTTHRTPDATRRRQNKLADMQARLARQSP
jgi:hypothetical protein